MREIIQPRSRYFDLIMQLGYNSLPQLGRRNVALNYYVVGWRVSRNRGTHPAVSCNAETSDKFPAVYILQHGVTINLLYTFMTMSAEQFNIWSPKVERSRCPSPRPVARF